MENNSLKTAAFVVVGLMVAPIVIGGTISLINATCNGFGYLVEAIQNTNKINKSNEEA